MKETLYIYKYAPKLNNQIYQCGSSFLLSIFKACIVSIIWNRIRYFFIDVSKLRCKHLKRKM